MILSLSILNADLKNIESYLKPIPIIPVLHLDIMDSKFVTQSSFSSDIVRRCHEVLPGSILDCHLMCVNPENYFLEYKDAGCDYLVFHIETGNVKENIDKIHSLGLKAGLAINPETNYHLLEPFLKDIDEVLVMSVHPGLGGQSFIESSIEKLKFLKEYKIKNDLHYIINVDGGINLDTYMKVKPYTDLCVVGSAITKRENYKDEYMKYAYLFLKED